MEASVAMRLTKQEALSLFSYLEIGHKRVLLDKLELLKKNPDAVKLKEMKRMMLLISIWENYKSEKVRDKIMDLNALFIRDFYSEAIQRISIIELSFLVHLSFSYRNIKTKNAIRHLQHDEKFMRYFRECYSKLARKV